MDNAVLFHLLQLLYDFNIINCISIGLHKEYESLE